MIDSRRPGLEGCKSDYSIVDNVCSVFLSIVGTEDIRMNLEPSAGHVMVIWTLMTFNAMKNICKGGDR